MTAGACAPALPTPAPMHLLWKDGTKTPGKARLGHHAYYENTTVPLAIIHHRDWTTTTEFACTGSIFEASFQAKKDFSAVLSQAHALHVGGDSQNMSSRFLEACWSTSSCQSFIKWQPLEISYRFGSCSLKCDAFSPWAACRRSNELLLLVKYVTSPVHELLGAWQRQVGQPVTKGFCYNLPCAQEKWSHLWSQQEVHFGYIPLKLTLHVGIGVCRLLLSCCRRIQMWLHLSHTQWRLLQIHTGMQLCHMHTLPIGLRWCEAAWTQSPRITHRACTRCCFASLPCEIFRAILSSLTKFPFGLCQF